MNLVISGKNIDITEGLRAAVEEKIGKLERYFNDSTEVHVTLSTEKNRQSGMMFFSKSNHFPAAFIISMEFTARNTG